jgi:opacity protein-like surface antigen
MGSLPRYLLLLTLLVAPGLAAAAQPDYDLLEALGFQTTSAAGDSRGLQLNGSYLIGAGFFAEGSASHVHDSDTDLSTDTLFGGLGYRARFQLTDVFLSVDWLHLGTDAAGTSTSQDGYRWVWGLRSDVTEDLELNFGIEKSSVGQTDVGLRIGESYAFSKTLSLRAQYVRFPDAHSWVLGLRYYY